MAVGPCPATLTPPPTEGVVGVRGTDPSCEDGDPRRMALLIGRKMPAPGIDVVKYEILHGPLANPLRAQCRSPVLPIHISAVLPSARELLAQLDASKHAILALHAAYVLDHAVHGARDVDQIPDLEIVAAPAGGRERRHPPRGRRVLVQHRTQTVALAGIGDGGQGARGEGVQG